MSLWVYACFFVHLPFCCLLYDSKLKNAPIIDIHNDDCTSKIEAICCCWTSNHNKESACVVRIFLILRLLIMRLSASYNTMSVYIWWAIINAPFWWYTCLPPLLSSIRFIVLCFHLSIFWIRQSFMLFTSPNEFIIWNIFLQYMHIVLLSTYQLYSI